MLTKYLKIFLWGYLIVMALAGIHIYGLTLKANGDNVEHLHTSWLIWQGKIPYRDFFQHHNPLTWYLSAPIVAAFIDKIWIYEIFNVLGVIILCCIAYYLCKIVRLSGVSYIGLLFLAAITISSYSLLWSTDYRPDTFMYLFLFVGLYYLFLHIRENKLQRLVISFLSFFISFMFTQKVLLNLVVPAGAIIYWLIIGKIKLKDVLFASILPVLLAGFWIAYLYANDALSVYWYANFPFNSYIPDIFDSHRIIFPPVEYWDFYAFLPFGGIAAVYFMFRGDYIGKVLGLMFIEETLLRFFYFSAFLHYVMFWLMLSYMLTIMMFDKLTKYKTPVAVCGIIYLLVMLGYNYAITYKTESQNRLNKTGYDLCFEELTPCDYAINGYYAVYNLKGKDPGYYGILLGQIDVLGEKSGIAKRDNLNELIRTKKPKVISAGIYWDTYWEERGKKIPAHQIDRYLVETYYDYSGVGDLHVLKPQYQKPKYRCIYNGKSWEYMD